MPGRVTDFPKYAMLSVLKIVFSTCALAVKNMTALKRKEKKILCTLLVIIGANLKLLG